MHIYLWIFSDVVGYSSNLIWVDHSVSYEYTNDKAFFNDEWENECIVSTLVCDPVCAWWVLYAAFGTFLYRPEIGSKV